MVAGAGSSTRARGQWAETLAADHLVGRGYRLVTRNYSCRMGEIDLIAWAGDILCFIEVRSRRSTQFGHPLETLGAAKLRRLRLAARHYLMCLSEPWPLMRFDALGIVVGPPVEFVLLQGAFEAT